MYKKPVNHSLRCFVALASACVPLLMSANLHAGVSQSEIDSITSNWKCQWCPYKKEPYKKGKVEVGAGDVSNDSFKHGDYTGLDEQGAYIIGNGSYEYKSADSSYVDVEVSDLGLDSRKVELEGGVQGKFGLDFEYSQLPKLISDTARTPYRGEENQRLPASWVQAANTAGMTQLGNSLRDIEIYTERKTLDIGATYYSSPSLSYDFNFQQQTKQGKKSMGLALLANSAILAVPVDTLTKQGGVKVNYHAQHWQGGIGYAFSIFDNAHDRVVWGNAYSNPVTDGQAALEPGNKMQQIFLDGAYRFSEDTRATAAMAFGQMTQNDDFLPYTVNGALSPSPLPRSSLDGKVNTYNATLRLNSRWDDVWRYAVQYRHNEQDNNTPRSTYNYVFADFVVSGTPRENLPYSFRERELSLQGRYQIDKRSNIRLEYERDTDDRTHQEVEKSNEDILSAMYRNNVNDNLLLSLRLKSSHRKGDEYTPVTEVLPPENTLLRKYNLADRKRKLVAVSLSYTVSDALQLSGFADYAYDDYSDSDVGLQDSRQSTVSFELQYRMNKALNMNVDYNITNIDSTQSGISWDADNEDRIDIAHVGLNYSLPKYKMLIGADASYANAIGDITVSTGSGFPSLESTRKTFTLFADYTLDDRSVVHASFAYEDYEEKDWSTNGVVPNTLSSVLTLGETSPSYSIGMFAISYETRF